MPTMKEVAAAAGVSVATVSHVINGTRFVRPALADRVREAMTTLGYTPDGRARSLRVRRTHTLGLVVPDNSNPFFAELARLVEEEGFDAGYTTILGNSTEQPERERRYVETLAARRVDGLIVAPSRHDDGTFAALLRASGIPVVVIDRDLALLGADLVVYDNVGGSRAAVAHLLELGHERIAYVAGPLDVATSRERLRGFRDAVADAAVELRDEWVVEGDFQYASGRAAAARLLDARAPVTAIFAANDLMAAGVASELGARGLRVPEDVSVVGYDDAPLAVMVAPTLTTVRQPLAEMAETAVSFLLDRIRGAEPDQPRRVVLPTELVVRESTDKAPTRRRRQKGVGPVVG